MQSDVALVHEIEAVIGKKLVSFECNEKAVLEDITTVREVLSANYFLFYLEKSPSTIIIPLKQRAFKISPFFMLCSDLHQNLIMLAKFIV